MLWLECFKFAMEQYGVENANNFLTENKDSDNKTLAVQNNNNINKNQINKLNSGQMPVQNNVM